MSAYDIVEVDYPLPDGADPSGVEYRTRDLGRARRRYRLDATGQLWLERDAEDERDPYPAGWQRLTRLLPGEVEWVAWPFGGTLCFYTRQRGTWRAYLALFRRGTCVHVERVGIPARGVRRGRCRARSRLRRG